MGHGEGMSAWLKRVSQKEFLPLLVKYLYQHVCLRQKTINKKKYQVAQQEITLATLLFGSFFPYKVRNFLGGVRTCWNSN